MGLIWAYYRVILVKMGLIGPFVSQIRAGPRPAHARLCNGRAYLRVYAPAIFGVLRSNTPHYYAGLQGPLL